MAKFRVYNRLLSSGFSHRALDLVTRPDYQLPMILDGEKSVEFYLQNPTFVEDKGLSLYIYSQDRGRGKTTLAHRVMYNSSAKFVDKDVYSTKRTYAFEHVEDFLKGSQKGIEEPKWLSTWYVLDDLGNEDRSSDWRKSIMLSALQRMLHYRRDKALPTIITTNYRPSDLSRIYDGELNSLLEIRPDGSLGGALFREVCVGGGEDLRLVDEYSAWPV
jgi:hypothetical protein